MSWNMPDVIDDGDRLLAVDLLISEMCSAKCLLALITQRDQCFCVCNGRFHSLLLEAEVPSEPPAYLAVS